MLLATATAGATAGICAAALAAAPAKITYTDGFTTTKPGAPSGRSWYDEIGAPGDPSAKPPAAAHFHLQLPAGARFDTSAVPQCTASDAQLMLEGAAACPPASKVGAEVFVGDTGLPGGSRFITADVDFFNVAGGIILLSQDRSSGARVVSHGKVSSDSEDIDVPLLPGTPPDGGVDKSERGVFYTATGERDGRPTAYLTTPRSCPASGRWLFTATYTFRDGSKQVEVAASPCHAPKRHRRARRHRPHRHTRS